jgi:MYXO-CTERM domain-containing protein
LTSALSGSATFNGTLASLGLTPGTYVYTWNSSPVGAALRDDSITVKIGVPEPSTWTMMALGFAGLGLAGFRSRRRSVPIAA